MSKYLVQYSAVLDGTRNPFGSPADHETSVERLLGKLMQTKTGLAVFKKIVTHGVVRILPYIAADYPKYGPCNALAFSGKHQEKVASGLHRTAVDVHFSVATWGAMSGCITGPGSLADEILLHELVHSMRYLGNESKHVELKGPKMGGYHNEEEFFAVLVANIYTSEMGRQPNWQFGSGNTGLRADHAGFNQLADQQGISVDFLMDADNFRLVKKFCDQHPKIAPMIGEAKARFNPIKVYLRWKGMKIEPKNGELVRSK